MASGIGALACLGLPAQDPHGPAHGPSPPEPAARGEYVETKGQWPRSVLYRADFGLLALFAERDRLVFSRLEDGAGEKMHDAHHAGAEAFEQLKLKGHAWHVWFEGADPAAVVTRSGPSVDYLNYFIGSDPSKWASEVRHFREVRYLSPWPGVDMRLHEEHGGFKYDLLLADASAADLVRLRYEGLDGLRIDGQGDLVLATSVGEARELAPVAWYADGAKE
ncbi:MAG: hypothetical protein ACK4L7_08930, partial [Flavobacteriales bacterium]